VILRFVFRVFPVSVSGSHKVGSAFFFALSGAIYIKTEINKVMKHKF
jgi:hypothetical protein